MNVLRDRSQRRHIVERTSRWFGKYRRRIVGYEHLLGMHRAILHIGGITIVPIRV